VLGSARHRIGINDFSSLLLQAQGSKADAVAFANAGGDTSNSLKQAAEFGLGQQQKLLALIMGRAEQPQIGSPVAAFPRTRSFTLKAMGWSNGGAFYLLGSAPARTLDLRASTLQR
jgi:ABC-type branched-subunit amino acid transport system substrate-binding protein